jgi:hypothetical protein
MGKIYVDGRSEEKHYIHGIYEALFVNGIHPWLFVPLVDKVTVECHLDFVAHLRSVRIASPE